MRQPTHNTATLPRHLLEEIGASVADLNGSRGKRNRAPSRKEQRKATRVQKNSGRIAANRSYTSDQRSKSDRGDEQAKAVISAPQQRVEAISEPKAPKSILKVSKSLPKAKKDKPPVSSPSASPTRQLKVSRAVQDRLAEDEAEIAALENALGVKGKKRLPKSFQDDGLDSLLEGIDDLVGLNEGRPVKRKRSDGEEWLDNKRQKAYAKTTPVETSSSNEDNEDDDSPRESDVQNLSKEENEHDEHIDTDEFDDSESSEGRYSQLLSADATKRPRENPYVAPTTGETVKYIPPSIRVKDTTELEGLSGLRRQIQGLLNKLSEANLVSIVNGFEQLYRNHPRQHVSSILLELLMSLLSDSTALQDTFFILHAGFIAALYRVIGTDFGAQAIQKIDEEFQQNYGIESMQEPKGKKLTYLICLLSDLYIFQVIGSTLIYDFIHLCLDDFSESNTELLLKLVRKAGPQLRQDDPSSLKDIVVKLQASASKIGEKNLSLRTKVMVEAISNLKNNRMKTGVVAAVITSEHTIRMKKTLGSLNTRNLKASEPLRISLKDLRNRHKVGTWWLVGASYKGEGQEADDRDGPNEELQALHHGIPEDGEMSGVATDLASLAKEQRMNTGVRQSVFIAIMSSSDYNDAYVRLMKLRLNNAQEREIAKVLIHCAGAEKVYNPFYTFLSRRVCSAKKLKISFQFVLWDLFNQMGEGDHDFDDDRDDEDKSKLGLRSLVNIAKLFGVLVAEDGLGLSILKKLNLAYLQPKTRMFVEILLITTILHSQQRADGKRKEKALLDIFLKPKKMSEMAGGLQYFLKKIVMRTDVAGNEVDKETLKWGCRVVIDALPVLKA